MYDGFLYASPVVAHGDDGLSARGVHLQPHLRPVAVGGTLLHFLHHRIDGILQQVHDGHAEQLRVAFHAHLLCGQGEGGGNVVFGHFLFKHFVQLLLVLCEEFCQADVRLSPHAVFEQLLHGFQHTRRIGAVLSHFLQVSAQHVEYVHGVVVGVGGDIVLLVAYVFDGVSNEILRELCEVVDVVQRVEDAVDESLCELSHGGHLLLPDKLVLCADEVGGALLHDGFQPVLVFLQPVEPELDKGIDDGGEQQDVHHNHVPPQVERRGDPEVHAHDVRRPSVGVACLHLKPEAAVGEVAVFLKSAGLPRAPGAAVQPCAVLCGQHQRGEVDSVAEYDMVLIVLQRGQGLYLFSVATPDDAVAKEHHRADSQLWNDDGYRVVPAFIDDGQAFVAAHPELVAPACHGLHGKVHERIDNARHRLVLLRTLQGGKLLALIVGKPQQPLVVGV